MKNTFAGPFHENRSSHRRSSVRKAVLRNFEKFTGKHQCQRIFFNKVADPRHRALRWLIQQKAAISNNYFLESEQKRMCYLQTYFPLKLTNHNISKVGYSNPKFFHRGKSIKIFLRKDKYCWKRLEKSKYWDNQFSKAFW